MTIQWIGANSANYQKGRGGRQIKYIVLHWVVGRLEAADATFQDPKRIASAHYGVGDNEIHQYVKDEDTAYHAGNFQVNQESIGIEHEGGPDLPISEATYFTSATLVADLAKRYAIPLDISNIWLHREIKATQCPGTLDRERIINMAKTINGQGGTMTPSVLVRDVIKAIYRKMIGREIPDGDLANEEAKQPFSVEDTMGRFMSPDFYKLYDLHTSKEVSDSYDQGFNDGKAQVPISDPTGPPDSPPQDPSPPGPDPTIPPVLDSPGGSSGIDNRSLLQRIIEWLFGKGGG